MRISDHSCKFFGGSECLSAFLSDVRKFEVPTIEEEETLITEYKNGNIEAGKKLICGHLRFIYSLAKIYARDENEVGEYVDEGAIGFQEAIDKYDITMGYKLITCAVWYVRRQMNAFLNKRSLVVRSNANKFGKKIDTVKNKYYAENGREASIDEVKDIIEKEYGIEVREECDLYDVNIASIDEQIDDDYTVEDNSEYNEKTATYNAYEEEVEKDYKRAMVDAALSLVPEKHAQIMRLLYGIGCEEHSTQEVGEMYGIRVAEVANIREKVIKYIQQNAQSLKKVL